MMRLSEAAPASYGGERLVRYSPPALPCSAVCTTSHEKLEGVTVMYSPLFVHLRRDVMAGKQQDCCRYVKEARMFVRCFILYSIVVVRAFSTTSTIPRRVRRHYCFEALSSLGM